MIKFRSIRSEEAEELWNMMNTLDYETKYMMYEPGERKKNIEGLKSKLEYTLSNNDLFLVAEDDNKLVGFISAEKGAHRRNAHTVFLKDFEFIKHSIYLVHTKKSFFVW